MDSYMHLEITGESCYLTPYKLACAKIEALYIEWIFKGQI